MANPLYQKDIISINDEVAMTLISWRWTAAKLKQAATSS